MSEQTIKGTPLWSDQNRTGWYQNAFDWFVKGAQTVDSTISSSTTKDKHGFTINTVQIGSSSYRLGVTRDFHNRFQMRDPVTGETLFKCEMPESQEEALTSGVEFAKSVATVKPASDPNISAKRQKIEKLIYDVVQTIDPSGDNTKRWQNLFGSMDDKQFSEFMEHLNKGECQLNVIMPNMKKVPRIPDLVKAAEKIGLKLAHRLWLPDRTNPGKKYLTNEEHLVLELPIRRAQQEWDKKLQVPSRDTHVDALTGQVILDDRACHLSTPEIQSLSTRGLEKTLQELVRVRGGDVNAYGDFKRQLEESGEASMNSLDPRTRARAGVLSHILLQSMMIDNNL